MTRSRTLGWLISGALVILAVGFVTIRALTPECPTANTCIWDAGVSMDIPYGWTTQPIEDGQFLVISPGEDAASRIVIEDGAAAMGSRPHATLSAVEASLVEALSDTSGSFTQVDGLSTERVVLPIGPAVRVRYVSTTTFIMSSSQATDSVWFFAGGRLLVVSWQQARGEAPGPPPPGVMLRTLKTVLDSVRTIPG